MEIKIIDPEQNWILDHIQCDNANCYVLTNGYIINTYGSCPDTSNDSKVTNHIMDTEDYIKQLIRPNDILILDKRFRDSIQHLKIKFKTLLK